MRVLHITNNYPSTKNPVFGIFVKEQIESLHLCGIDNDMLIINGRENGKVEYLKSICRINSRLSKNKYDVIHCHHALSAICYLMSMKSHNNNCVVSFQNDPVNEINRFLYNWIYKSFDKLILKSYNENDCDKIEIVPNGVDINFFVEMERSQARKKIGLENDKKYILFVSSNFIRKQKRYDKFLEVIDILRTKYSVKDLEIIKLVNVDRSYVPIYFNAVDVHLLTSDFEGSPNSVKECMACNTQVVSTDVGDVRQLLSNVEGSYVANKGGSEELADLVYKAISYKNKINSREALIQKQLDMFSVANKIIKLYQSI